MAVLSHSVTHPRNILAVIHSSIRFDTQTETPLLILPATGTYLQDPFLIDFTIKEQANTGTVLLKIIPTGVGETDAR